MCCMDSSDGVHRRALELLHLLAGPSAGFRDGQLEAIRALVEDRSRVLVVQRTGWGKSAVYLVTTKLLRESGSGPTILISPLLALMRNQIAMAKRAGVRAATINSSNTGEWERIREELALDSVDLLLVAPERFANAGFQDEVLPALAERSGLVVIDEVHCVSDWGHDFRPDYLRVKQVLDGMPEGIPVVGTTATANDRVVRDISEQLGTGLTIHRGGLARSSLRLHVFGMPAQAQRLAWLVEALERLPGTGICYCLTVRDADRVTEWLQLNGIDAVGYHAGMEDADRLEVEEALLDNRVKAVVATSALGMGFDKPDLAFVIHYQSPGSPVAYYQQVGRAGRGLDRSWGVLLAGAEDRDIQDWFIDTAFPPQGLAERIVACLQEGQGMRLRDLESRFNIKRSRLQQMLKVLEVDGAIVHEGGRYRRTAQPWSYPAERIAGITAQRRREQQVMAGYREHDGCLMEYLGQVLDDPEAAPCGVCMNCAGPDIDLEVSADVAGRATSFLRNRPIVIEPRKQWPGGPRSGRIAQELRLEPGRALCEWGDGGWSDLVQRGRSRDGAFARELVQASADLIRQWDPQPAPQWVTYVPSANRETLLAGFAAQVAGELGLPVHAVLAKTARNRPQKEMQNSVQQFSNVQSAFAVTGEVPAAPVLLVDDLFDSKWTLTVVGAQLREAGGGPVFPFVLAAAVGS